MTKIPDCWVSNYPPRDNQLKAVEWFTENSDKTYFVLSAPVGSGKSLIGLSFSKFFGGGSYVLTPQKILQDQYAREDSLKIAKPSVLYGLANYECSNHMTTCSTGKILNGGKRCAECPHSVAVSKAKNCSNSVMNYRLALLYFEYTDQFGYRKSLVADECHNLEDQLVDYNALTVTSSLVKELNISNFPRFSDNEMFMEWVETHIEPILYSKIEALEESLKINKTPEKAKKLDRYTNLVRCIASLSSQYGDDIKNNTVLTINSNEKGVLLSISLKPLWCKENFKNLMQPMGGKFLFMSGTVNEQFINDVGLDPDKTTFLSLDSSFDVNNRPVVYMPTTKMNAGWNNPSNKDKLDEMYEKVVSLLQDHKTERGLIHTGNFKISEWICSKLLDDKRINHHIFHHNPSELLDRKVIIDAFTNVSQPAVLISPSITEGLDLKGDKGRFSIVLKCPYPNLADPWVKKRMDISKKWYNNKTLSSIIQASGRIVRSEEDFGITYILDSSFGYLYQSNIDMVPKYWQDSLIQM
jgi:Rad3-related DNA helicase